MAMLIPFGWKVAKMIFGKKNEGGTPGAAAAPWPLSRKVRIYATIPTLLTAIVVLLSVLVTLAGSKPGQMGEYDVFTLNVSRIGEGLHQEIDGAVNGINFDDLHVDLVKRSVPANSPATMTTAPTTLVTMAPRSADVGDRLSSLTQEAGDKLTSAKSDAEDKLTSAKSAANSKVSSVKSKASSAANSVESSINSGIDSAEDKIKKAILDVVNNTFKDLISSLDLDGFYSFYLSNTCQGNYLDEAGKNVTVSTGPVPEKGIKKHVDSCSKNGVINPVGIFVGFYWVGIILAGVTHLLGIVAIWKLSTRWINWTLLANAGAFFVFGVASAVVHGISHGAESLVDFVGNGISVDGKAGAKFITMTWAITLILLVTMFIWAAIRWFLKRHPIATSTKLGSDPYAAGASMPMKTFGGSGSSSGHSRQDRDSEPPNGYGASNAYDEEEAYRNPGRAPPVPQPTHDRTASQRYGDPGSGMPPMPAGAYGGMSPPQYGSAPSGRSKAMPPGGLSGFTMPYGSR